MLWIWIWQMKVLGKLLSYLWDTWIICAYCTSLWDCVTCSRSPPLFAEAICPRPLRSGQFPMGLLGLYGSLECVQLATANRIYLMTADFCAWLSNRNINWSVENPGRSYLRELSCFIRLHSLALFYDFVLCRWQTTGGGSIPAGPRVRLKTRVNWLCLLFFPLVWPITL